MEISERDAALLSALQTVAESAALEGQTLAMIGTLAAQEGLWEKWAPVFEQSLKHQEAMLKSLQAAMALLSSYNPRDTKDLH
jgi:uncharacterized protein HemY